jgi:C-terminal processing protease CtpA/Prc
VNPNERPGFQGPVVLLIGRDCASACETFAMATMRRQPSVVRLGENTGGVFSDVLERRLPNGWHFGLSNEVYRTGDGRTFEGTGVPPDIATPIFTRTDLQTRRDPAIERALELLSRSPRN